MRKQARGYSTVQMFQQKDNKWSSAWKRQPKAAT